MDALDDLMADLYWRDSGWSRVVNPETGAVGLFPEVTSDVDQWEQRSIQMHENQVPIHLEAKPVTNILAKRVVRGD